MVITYIAWTVLLIGFFILYSEFESLPDQVPIKYNFDGSIQKRGPKSTLYVLVGVGFFVGVLLTGLIFKDDIRDASLILEATHLLTQLLFTYLIYQTIKITKGEAEGLDKLFYLLMISVMTVPLLLALMVEKSY